MKQFNVCGSIAVFLYALVAVAPHACASLILDFKPPIQSGSYYEEKGIAFQNVRHEYVMSPPFDKGSLYLDSTTIMWAVDGSLFQPVSVALRMHPLDSGGPYAAYFTGNRPDGSTFEQQFSVNHLDNTYIFDDSFGYVSSISIDASRVVANDSFTLNVVPEPGSIILFALGVGVLLFRRRSHFRLRLLNR